VREALLTTPSKTEHALPADSGTPWKRTRRCWDQRP
jgi:hypothetical protein